MRKFFTVAAILFAMQIQAQQAGQKGEFLRNEAFKK